ncbi:sigma-70 family RNA polymerase sigma factor [candidate division KSB1 bacterium]|nr:sigma-70 family RNA polymerase sigma factor [candidate division KSB1 bacterium]RQW03122.1 MAG: sigma-70 family RNA polymerase sigma factor [candidate division KSB1 bacterium]
MISEQRHRLEKSFQREHAGLLGFVSAKIPMSESEDLVQEVYVQALRNLNVLEAVDNLTGWLYTVARNKIIDWYRRKKVPTVPLDVPDENGTSLSEILAEEIPVEWDDETRELVFDAIVAAVDELPEKQRYVFIQNVVEGRTFRDIAEETNESINTLLARKRYALMFLQSCLQDIRRYVNER